MIGSFAGLPFTVSEQRVRNFNGLNRETSARFATHEVIGSKPKKEFLGPGFDSGSFTMELNAEQGVSPLAVIRTLDSYIRSGRSSWFILGGRSLGKYVILSKSEEYEIITRSGKVVKAKVDVSMEEYR